MKMIRTSVVILNWNGLEYLKRFLGQVVKYSAGEGTAIYVADNGSTDSSCEWVEANFPEVGVLRLGKNYGFAGGYNRALDLIDSYYYMLLNSDIEVTEGWLDPLVRHLNNHNDVASCQPVIRSFHDRKYFEHAGAAGGFIDKYGYPFCRGRIFSHVEQDKGQYTESGDIFWSTGACMLVRAEAWKNCGGLDDSFFAHMEEIDLCWRFHRYGYRVSVVTGPVVYHVGGGALKYNSPRKTYLNFRNSLFMLYRNLPEKDLNRVIFIRKVLDGAAAIMFFLKGQFCHSFAVLRAHIDYYRNKALIRAHRREFSIYAENSSRMILNKSVVFEFYIRRKKTFTAIVKESNLQ